MIVRRLVFVNGPLLLKTMKHWGLTPKKVMVRTSKRKPHLAIRWTRMGEMKRPKLVPSQILEDRSKPLADTPTGESYFVRDLDEKKRKKIMRDPEALARYLKENQRLVGYRVAAWINRLYPHQPARPRADEDAQQVGTIALWESLKAYKPSKRKGTTLGSWIVNGVNQAVANFFAGRTRLKRGGAGKLRIAPEPKSIDDPDVGGTLAIGPESESIEEYVYQKVLADIMREKIEKQLGPKEKKLFGTMFTLTKKLGRVPTQREMAKVLKVSQPRVNQLFARLQQAVVPLRGEWRQQSKVASIRGPECALLKSIFEEI